MLRGTRIMTGGEAARFVATTDTIRGYLHS
jgi:hypothetical protein